MSTIVVPAEPREHAALPRVCVLLPTYNNDPTLERVLESIPPYVGDIIVVNDGCTDGTAEVLARFPDVDVVVHARNRGKGAALQSGFERALERGFTHAISMDSDGQHLAADLPKFLEAVQAAPDAIVVGVRDLSGDGPPKKSRYLRHNSNFWTWVETGVRVADTQSGFRAYPLERLRPLAFKTTRYDFEIEVLVKAIWQGIPVREVPVQARYNTGSRSHFRPLPDFSLVTRLNVHLVVQRFLLPPIILQAMHLKSFQDESVVRRAVKILRGAVLYERPTPAGFAGALGLGACFAILPIWGFQMAGAMLAAHYLRLSRVLTLVAANLSFPPIIPLILYASLVTGRFVLHDGAPAVPLTQVPSSGMGSTATEYVVGSLVLAIAVGITVGVVSYLLARAVLLLRRVDA